MPRLEVLGIIVFGIATLQLSAGDAVGKCWQEPLLQAICCEGAWGGLGCWEGGRNFNSCCRQAATVRVDTSHVPSKSCTSRLKFASSLLDPKRVFSTIRKIEGKVLHQVKQFNVTVESRENNVAVQTIWPFLMQPSVTEREMLYELTATLIAEFDHRKLTYWASGGTLIGMLRHYGPIPWDDDVTLGVLASDKLQVQAALDAVLDHFLRSYGAADYIEVKTRTCESECGLFALFFKKAPSFNGNAARFPAVRVDWFDTRGTSPAWEHYFGHLESPFKMLGAVLPVVAVRPFGHLLLFQPHDPWAYLDLYLDSYLRKRGQQFYDWCQSRSHYGNSRMNASFENAEEFGMPDVSILPCKLVAGVHPMVLYAGVFRGEDGAKAFMEQFGKAPGSLKSLPGTVTLEVAIDRVRGAHVVLWAEGTSRDQCWVKLFGAWDFIRPQQAVSF